jgi:hypothetical protein
MSLNLPERASLEYLKEMAAARGSVTKGAPMFFVRDMRARLSFGNGEFALSPGGTAGPR